MCLESLEEHAPASVTVVDNASADGTLELLRERFPAVRAIANGENRGFAAATNQGIREGSERYVLALNPDTRLTKGALDQLAAVLDDRPEVGICGPRLVRDDGSFDHAARRSFPTVTGALGHFLAVGRHPRAPGRLAQYRAPAVEAGPVDAVNGAFMLMRRAVLDEVGLFDEGYWMYMEDLDLCYRFREAGWVTWYEPSVTVGHVKAGSSGPIRGPHLNYAFHYGMARFYRKHYAPTRNGVANAAVYAGIAGKLAVSVARSAARTHVSGRLRMTTPRHAWAAHLRRSAGRTRPGTALKRRLRGTAAPAAPRRPEPSFVLAGDSVLVPGTRVAQVTWPLRGEIDADVVLLVEEGAVVEGADELAAHALAEGVGVAAPAGAASACAAIARDRLEGLGATPPYATARCGLADLALRAQAAGYRNVLVPRVAVRRADGAPGADPLDEALLEDRWAAPA